MTPDAATAKAEKKDQTAPDATVGGGGDSAPAGGGGTGDRLISFGDQLYIHADRRVAHYDKGPVKAYAASGRSDNGRANFYALVCELSLSPRFRLGGAYSSIVNPTINKLVASGPVYWAPAREERYVFIYENAGGGPLMREGDLKGLDMKPDLAIASVLKPLVYALMDLRDADIVHGNVRPSNIYGTVTGDAVDRIVLGDCLCTPPSYSQPVLFETIERAMADPIGRGMPTMEGDIYALGVTMALLLRSRDPMEGMDAEAIIRMKIEQGSYTALTSKDRFNGPVLELLRGLLYDDIDQRWTLEDIIQWMDGQRLSPKPPAKKIKAARPIHFNEERYFRPTLLAMDLNKNQGEAVQMVENGNLEQWIGRSLENPQVMKRYETMQETVAELGRGPGYWDRLLCRLSIALDPDAPVRYKGMNLTPEGFGAALTEAFVKQQDLSPYIDIITQQTILFWVGAAPDARLDVGTLVGKFDGCRAFMRQDSPAYGIERCVYFLNPECHCLSEKLKGYFVRSPEDMMRAFEKISGAPKRPDLFLDRHSIAYLSVKDRKDIDPYLMELNAPEYHRRVMGNVKTLATIQQRSRLEKFPGICRWIVDILDPVYEQFHDRELRKAIAVKAARMAESGDVTRIAALLDNPQTYADDQKAYNEARMDYYKLRKERAKIEGKLSDPETLSKTTGREVAAIFSCFVSGIIILFIAFMTFSGNLGF